MKKEATLNTVIMTVTGAFLGFLSKYLDIHSQALGNMFSEMSIWILFGVVIAVFSSTRKIAMVNILVFSFSMLLTYYVTAHLTHSIYGWAFIKGWSVFALFSPVFAYFTWLTKEKGLFPKIISCGIIFTTLFVDILLFGGPRIYDFVILFILVYILFVLRIDRSKYS